MIKKDVQENAQDCIGTCCRIGKMNLIYSLTGMSSRVESTVGPVIFMSATADAIPAMFIK